MERRALLKSLSVLAAATPVTKALAQAVAPVYSAPATLPPYEGRLRPGVVAMSFRNQLETGKMTYEDAVRAAANLGLEGMDMTGYWVPPLLPFTPGLDSHVVSDMVRAHPANPGKQWLASLRRTAYHNGIEIYSVGTPVKMAQPTAELRQKEIAFAKRWVDIAYELGAGHVRVFAGNLPKGAAEEQAVDWAVEVYKPVLDYAGSKGLAVGVEDDDELTRTSAQLLAILKKADSPFARINIDCGNFPQRWLRRSRAVHSVWRGNPHQNQHVDAGRQARAGRLGETVRYPREWRLWRSLCRSRWSRKTKTTPSLGSPPS